MRRISVMVAAGAMTLVARTAAAKHPKACVDAIDGSVDMACLGGKHPEASQMAVHVGAGRDEPGAADTLFGALAGVRDCHRGELGGKHPTMAGVAAEVDVRLSIDRRGKVTKADVTASAPPGSKLVPCVTRKLAALRFQRGKGAAAFTLDASFVVADRGVDMEAALMAAALTSEDGGFGVATMQRRPGTDLDQQIHDVRDSVPPGGAAPPAQPPAAVGRSAVGTVTSPDHDATPDAVATKVTQVYLSGVTRCYRDALKQAPTLTGTVTLTFTVNGKGRVVAIATTGLPAVAPCVGKAAAGWTFARADDVGYTVPFTFTPR